MSVENNDPRKLKVLDRIQATMSNEIEAMNVILRSELLTDHDVVNGIVDNYLRIKGKQIRPILVMLSARMFGEINDRVLHCAAALEMLHNATLIHDDVIDQTPTRRGEPTINAVWGNHIAVLVGDLFVSRALKTGIKTGSLEIIKTMSDMGSELSLGEMDQLFIARSHVLSRKAYFDTIYRKTASLFMGCVRMGAQAVGATEQQFGPLEQYARLLGEAFQIRDDIFDYFPSDDIGKPSGHDLLEGKVTLPLLLAIENASDPLARDMEAILKDDSELTHEKIKELQDFAKKYGGIEGAREEMASLREEGLRFIKKYPESQSRKDFEDIFEYIIERKY